MGETKDAAARAVFAAALLAACGARTQVSSADADGGAMPPAEVGVVADAAREETPEDSAVDTEPCVARVETLAGSGVIGVADGPADLARFTWPKGVTIGDAGVIYVAEGTRVRAISGGAVSTVAGTDQAGYADGTAASSAFYWPYGIAAGAGERLYVADYWNHRVRLVEGQSVSTLAGSGPSTAAPGCSADPPLCPQEIADGPLHSAKLSMPVDVAVSPLGAIYLSDGNGTLVRAIASGAVVTIAGGGADDGDGPALKARLRKGSVANRIAADAAGRVYVTEANRVRVIEGGQIRTIAGGQAGYLDGPALAARFKALGGIALGPKGRVYVADGHCIRAIEGGLVRTLAGSCTAKAGGFADGPPEQARFYRPAGLALSEAGVLYIADTANHRVRALHLCSR